MSECQLPTPQGDLVVRAADRAQTWFSLVVPTYNERQNVRKLVEQVSQALDSQYAGKYEIIIADDNSPDGTAEEVAEVSKNFPQLHVVVRKDERGLASAVIRGWQASSGEVLGVIDGDLQHPPEVLLNLLEQMENGADLALASRHLQEGGLGTWGALRRLTSKGAQLLGMLIVPQTVGRVTDPMSGFFVVRRACLIDRKMEPEGYKILLEVLGRGLIKNIREVPYVFQLRQHGQTKVTWREYVAYIQHLFKLRSYLARKKEN